MTFLNPLVLIGLAAASIPLILHLLNLRKPRTIEFSTLAFLKELQQTSIRRLKLRQILLLILRTALIVFIVLAFARPALRGSLLGTIGTHAHTSVVLLLDDTFSMAASDEHGNLFRQSQEKALQLLSLLNEGDEISLLRFSEFANPQTPGMTHDFAASSSAVEESRITATSASLDNGLRHAAKALATSHNANKEIYILSDMQRTLFTSTASTPENLFTPETKFFFLQVGPRGIDNVAVDSVSVMSQILEVGKPAVVTARVFNYGNAPLRNYVVSAYLDGQRVAQRNLDIAPWSSAHAEFTLFPKKPGLLSGYVAIEDDAIEYDNKRWFLLQVPERISVLFISPTPNDVRYLILTLTTHSTEEKNTLFSVRHLPPQQFALTNLGQVDVLVLCNVPGISEHDAARIKTFVEQGGGLIVFPGDAMDQMNYNTTLLPLLSIPPFEGRNEISGESAGLIFQRIDIDHPIFHGVFESTGKQTQQRIESPQFTKTMKRQAGKLGRIVISLSDQTPFLAEYRIGDGIGLMFSSAPNPSWSDMHLKGLFAPLIYRSTMYASARAEQNFSARVGEAPTLVLKRRVQSTTGNRQLTLVTPSKTEEILQHNVQSTVVGSSITFSTPYLSEPGIYEVRSGQQTLAHLSVNVAPPESDLRRAAADDRNRLLSTLGIDPSRIIDVSHDDRLSEIVLQSRYGVELWKLFLIAALVVALAEMAVARDSKKQVDD